MKTIIKCSIAVIFLLAGSNADAQTFLLKDGQTLNGDVKRESEDFFILRGQDGANVVLLKSKLAVRQTEIVPAEEAPAAYSGQKKDQAQPPAVLGQTPPGVEVVGPPAVSEEAITQEAQQSDSYNSQEQSSAADEKAAETLTPLNNDSTTEPAAQTYADEKVEEGPAAQTEISEAAVQPEPNISLASDDNAVAEGAGKSEVLPVLPAPLSAPKVESKNEESSPNDEPRVENKAAVVSASYPWVDGTKGYDKALEIQKATGSPFMLYFYTNWSPACKKFKKTVLNDAKVKDAFEPVVKVSVNADIERKLMSKFNVTDYPALLLVFSDGQVTRVRTESDIATILSECEGLGLRVKA